MSLVYDKHEEEMKPLHDHLVANKMKEAKHCYILSNGVSVVVGDRVELIATNGERYIGDIYDMTENSISCTLTDGTGEAGFFFRELEDVRLVK